MECAAVPGGALSSVSHPPLLLWRREQGRAVEADAEGVHEALLLWRSRGGNPSRLWKQESFHSLPVDAWNSKQNGLPPTPASTRLSQDMVLLLCMVLAGGMQQFVSHLDTINFTHPGVAMPDH